MKDLLSTIVTSGEFINRSSDSDFELAKRLTNQSTQAARTLILKTSDLLDQVGFENGTFESQPIPSEVGKAVQEIVDAHKQQANYQNTHIRMTISKELKSKFLIFDSARFQQVLMNVL